MRLILAKCAGQRPLGGTEHYLGAHEGGAVGLDQTPQRFTDWSVVERLDPRTPIDGLWLTGQDILTCGVTGAMMAGLMTTTAMVGMRRMGPLMKRIYS